MNKIRKAPKGILGFPVAPFTTSNKLDEQALAQNIQFLIDGDSRLFSWHVRQQSIHR